MSVVEVDTTMLVISQATGIYKLNYNKDNLADFKLDSCGWYGSSFGGVSYIDGLLLFKNDKLMKFSKNSLKYCKDPTIIKSNSVTWEASVVNDSSVYLAQWGVTVNSGGLFTTSIVDTLSFVFQTSCLNNLYPIASEWQSL